VDALPVGEILDFGHDGTGIRIGILSDSFDCLGGAAAGVVSGDLPPGTTVLLDGCAIGGTDEGRAMAELIHDVAPGAILGFHIAGVGQAGFADGITALAGPMFNADIIVDDILYLREYMFQDGIVAQAVDNVVASGVAYFSAARNDGRQSYESTFRASNFVVDLDGDGQPDGCLHDFDPGPGDDPFQSITFLGPAVISLLVFQWDGRPASAGGSLNHVTLCYDTGFLGFDCFDNPMIPNIGSDPIEDGFIIALGGNSDLFIQYDVFDDTPGFAGTCGVDPLPNPPGFIKYVSFTPDLLINEYDNTASSTLYGHPNAAGAEAVGAAAYYNTPPFGVDPAVLNGFSSAGGTPILFDTAGTPIGPIVRQKPEVVGPDGSNTTFFGTSDIEPDGFLNFFGTSAAAPNVAALAAQMLQCNSSLTPAQIYSCLETTADDIVERSVLGVVPPPVGGGGGPALPVGFDFDSGFGYVNGPAAMICACGEDHGDAPNTYPTLVASGGPSHGVLPGLQLGSCVDSESDGIPATAGNPANGDNAAAAVGLAGSCGVSGNEDANPVLTGYNGSGTHTVTNIPVVNTTGSNAFLVGYIDWNGDGDFGDTGERSATDTIASSTSSTPVMRSLNWTSVPATPTSSVSYARFRLSTDQTAVESPGGHATDGEVEDYDIAAGSLPVTLSFFESYNINKNQIRIDWNNFYRIYEHWVLSVGIYRG
jgi:hypothetical protein